MAQAEVQFGKYQLLERIAAGGMAEIYRARYQAAQGVTKPVVIKKILPHYAGNKNFISMFVNEAKIAVGLSHGNIAQVFDFGDVDGEYFLAMEFVHGQALSKVLRKSRASGIPTLPVPFAVSIAIEMSKGLHYAHTRLDEKGQPLNIIHRDVSPQNVILSYEGQVKIVDFGIAKARHASQVDTESGAVKGKYVYFAPEQARGRELDSRTDIFATGIVLYEMLCGKLPFEGKMMDVLGKIIRGDFPRPRALNPDIPAPLERILLTAMTIEKSARYETAQAFQDALAGYLYSNAPTFSSGSLGALMSFLYEKELMAEGIPVKVPPDFLEHLSSWRKPAVLDDDEEEDVTRSDKPKSIARTVGTPRGDDSQLSTRVPQPPAPSAAPTVIEDIPADLFAKLSNPAVPWPSSAGVKPGHPGIARPRQAEPRPATPPPLLGGDSTRDIRTGRPPPPSGLLALIPAKYLYVAAPFVAMLIAGAAVVTFSMLGNVATLEVRSGPIEAYVKIDGKPTPRPTPIRITDLSAGEVHRVEVYAPGRKAWIRNVTLDRGDSFVLQADLEEDPPQRAPRP